MTKFLPPVHLQEEHLPYLKTFSCGDAVLDGWLQNRALLNEKNKASRTYLVFADTGELAGFFSISANAIVHELLNAASRRNMPDPVPVVLIGRLAVGLPFQGMKLGGAILSWAVGLSKRIAELGGAAFVAVHPISESAASFYRHYGFKPAQQNGTLLLLRI